MVPLKAGANVVTVDYPGPTGLRLAYYFSLIAWIGICLIGLRRFAIQIRDLCRNGPARA